MRLRGKPNNICKFFRCVHVCVCFSPDHPDGNWRLYAEFIFASLVFIILGVPLVTSVL